MDQQPTNKAKGSSATTWNVIVRHSPFLLKNADIDAATPDEAKSKFLELARDKHEKRAARVPEQRGLDLATMTASQRAIRDAFKRGVEAQHNLEWVIRPAAEVKQERDALKSRLEALAKVA